MEEEEIDIFLLKIHENVEKINLKIIPKTQYENISQYNKSFDRNRRLLARSFLFEYCSLNFNLNKFNFSFNEYLKPSFKESDIKFNISYSNQYILIAISKNREIGIDIEYKHHDLKINNLCNVIMHKEELLYFKKFARFKERLNFFYELWTGKESLVKACGMGLYYPITSIFLTKTHAFGHNGRKYLYNRLKGIDNNYALAITYQGTSY